MKAMLLAAGRGERLLPLTDTLPKALVEAGGRPLLAWHLERLAAAGIREAVINVSHLGAQIRDWVAASATPLRIAFSEEAEPLETAGGIAQALPLLGGAPFLLVNADIWCALGLAALRARALDGDLAHLVLVPNPPQHPRGDFALAGGRVAAAGTPRLTYAGIALVDPALVAGVHRGDKAPLAPLLRAAAAAGRLSGERYDGAWHDAGTPERLQALRAALAAG